MLVEPAGVQPDMAVILIVDCEIVVINVVRIALKRMKHTVHTALTEIEACRLADSAERLDVLIVDYWVPPGSGRDLAERILQRHTRAKVMHIAGYPREHLEAQGHLLPGAAFLGKPFSARQIQDGVTVLLSAA